MKKITGFYKSWLHRRFTIHHWLLISCLFSLALLLARVIISGRLSYAFLAWNLFLGYIPFYISEWLGRHPKIITKRIKLVPLLFLWILFMPNSFYMLTDLFHLDDIEEGQSWFDLTLILSFAWTGILFGILSIRKMEILLKNSKGPLISGLVIFTVMWLNAFGIYIGRFLRFNSWDIITDPFSLITEVWTILFYPYDHRYVWAMSFCFAFLMLIIYYTTKKLSEGIKR